MYYTIENFLQAKFNVLELNIKIIWNTQLELEELFNNLINL